MNFYSLVDGFFGKIIEDYPEETIIILSDHGFGPRRFLLSEIWELNPFEIFPKILTSNKCFSRIFEILWLQ